MKQGFDSAVIVDSKGIKRGSIIVRYTDGTYRYNTETSVLFYHNEITINCDDDLKGDTYNKDSLFKILAGKGARCFDYSGEEFFDDHKIQEGRQISGISMMCEVESFKLKNRIYKILWV